MLLDTLPRLDNPLLDRLDLRDSTASTSGIFDYVSQSQKSVDSDFQASIKGLLNLDEIVDEEIDDEDEIVLPSSYAFNEAYKLLMQVREFFQDAFPYCSSSLETKGGIDLVWDNRFLERRVWVEIPVKKGMNGAVFYREKGDSKFLNRIDSEQVIRLLLWLNDSQVSIENI